MSIAVRARFFATGEIYEAEHPRGLISASVPQPYQAAWLLLKKGSKPARGDVVSFVKVRPFRFSGRQFTVKPTSQTSLGEVNVSDYIRNLTSSLSQTFEAMGIKIDTTEGRLTDFT
jgi:hypothetical protein